MGHTLRLNDLAEHFVDQGICWRVQLEEAEPRVLLDSVLVEDFVEERVCSLCRFAQCQDDQW